MRPLYLLLLALAGVLGGGALIGTAALGGCLIFVSLAAGAFGFLLYDFPEHGARPAVHAAPSLPEFLQRKAAENW